MCEPGSQAAAGGGGCVATGQRAKRNCPIQRAGGGSSAALISTLRPLATDKHSLPTLRSTQGTTSTLSLRPFARLINPPSDADGSPSRPDHDTGPLRLYWPLSPSSISQAPMTSHTTTNTPPTAHSTMVLSYNSFLTACRRHDVTIKGAF